MVKTWMQERQIQNEIDRHAIACSCCRQPYPFIGDVGTGDIFTEPVAQHESDVRLSDVLLEFDGHANANAISLGNPTQKLACSSVDPDALHARFAVAVPVIDVR